MNQKIEELERKLEQAESEKRIAKANADRFRVNFQENALLARDLRITQNALFDAVQALAMDIEGKPVTGEIRYYVARKRADAPVIYGNGYKDVNDAAEAARKRSEYEEGSVYFVLAYVEDEYSIEEEGEPFPPEEKARPLIEDFVHNNAAIILSGLLASGLFIDEHMSTTVEHAHKYAAKLANQIFKE